MRTNAVHIVDISKLNDPRFFWKIRVLSKRALVVECAFCWGKSHKVQFGIAVSAGVLFLLMESENIEERGKCKFNAGKNFRLD